MRLTIIGSSGTYPVAGRPASGYLIEQGPTRVWCEAGPGTMTALPVALDLIDAVFVSHRHPDHCSDVVTASHALAYGPAARSGVPLYGPHSALEAVAEFGGSSVDRVFDMHPLDDGDHVEVGHLHLEVAVSAHSVPTLATRWSSATRSITYSGDTGPGGDWVRLADKTDLFLVEATYQGESGVADYPYHLTAAEAGRIARERQAKAVMLTHIPPHSDPARSVIEAEATFGREVALAVPGLSVTI